MCWRNVGSSNSIVTNTTISPNNIDINISFYEIRTNLTVDVAVLELEKPFDV